MNQIKFEIGEYNENKSDTAFIQYFYDSIEEAISNIDFLKLSYNYFSNNKALAVRLQEGSQVHLIDYHTVYPILEFKKELIEKYTLQNNTTDETDENVEFIVQDRKTKTDQTLNSNFEFTDDANTQYAKTSTGEQLPFRLFNADDSETRSNLLRKDKDSESSTDFALIERRFTENNSLQFYGNEKIEDHNDVAWLFKALEDEAVEHAFLVYHFADKGYFVQHISTGTYNAALVENKLLIGNVLKAKPTSVTLVHNHPSGNLKASKSDFECIEKLKNALLYSDIEVNAGIIVNLRSGKYLVFSESTPNDISERKSNSEHFKEIQAYSFSKQILIQNYQPHSVSSSKEVAAFISSQKFGISDKTEMLILNAQLSIIGKFIMPPQNTVDFIIEKVTQFGGHNCIIYGNNITPRQIDFYNDRLKHSQISIIDGILFKSNNAEKIYSSFMDDGLLNKLKISDIGESATDNDNTDLAQELWINPTLNENIMEINANEAHIENNDDLDSKTIFATTTNSIFNNQTQTIMEQNLDKQEKTNQELEIGRYANIKDADGTIQFKGTIKSVAEFEVTLENKKGESHSAPPEQIYQYFFGQKHDLSEIKDMLQNKRLPAGLELQDFSSKDMTQMMKGEQTDTLFKGVKKEEGKDSIEYEFKLIPRYDNQEKKLIPQPEWKLNNFNLSESKIFGQNLSEADRNKLAGGEKIIITTIKGDKEINFKVAFDDKLNNVVALGFVNQKNVKQQIAKNENLDVSKKTSNSQKL